MSKKSKKVEKVEKSKKQGVYTSVRKRVFDPFFLLFFGNYFLAKKCLFFEKEGFRGVKTRFWARFLWENTPFRGGIN